MQQPFLRAYFGHHKCASTWLLGLMRELAREAGLRHLLVLNPRSPHADGPLTDYEATFDGAELGTYLQREGIEFVSHLTADAAHVETLGPFKGFNVVRDPRDIIVSAYFSHLHSHPTDNLPHLQAHRERLQQASQEEGLLMEMAFSRHEMEELYNWDYTRPEILEFKMEELTAQPYESFLRIFGFLELLDDEDYFLMKKRPQLYLRPVLARLRLRSRALREGQPPLKIAAETLLGRVYAHRFAKKAGGRKKGRENIKSHYRKGVAGDWINHLTPDHVAYFKEQYNEVLLKLGYESDPDWDRQLVRKDAEEVRA